MYHPPIAHGSHTFFIQVIIENRKVTVRALDHPVHLVLLGNVQSATLKLPLLAVECFRIDIFGIYHSCFHRGIQGFPSTGAADAALLRSHPSFPTFPASFRFPAGNSFWDVKEYDLPVHLHEGNLPISPVSLW